MCYVEIRSPDDKKNNSLNLEIALKKLKRKMKKENVLQDLKKSEFHVSPSAKRKLKRQEALKRLKREEIKSKRPKLIKN